MEPASAGRSLYRLDAAQVAGVLEMTPHREGGYFRETYRSPMEVSTPAGVRSLCTSILYMITADDPSRFHRLRFDEVWFFHAGSPVEMIFLGPLETVVLGQDSPQALAPAGRWMAARILGTDRDGTVPPSAGERGRAPGTEASAAPDRATTVGRAWALVGCVVNPGFDYDDFEAGMREDLQRLYPDAGGLIAALT